MFLPDYLEKGFDNAITSGKALVASKQSILPAAPLEPATTWFRPELFFSIFFLLIAGLTFIRNKVVVTTLRIFDLVFFFILGLLGVLLLFMWFGTDHVLCSDNYNLLWALPTHLPVVFFWNSKKQWLKRYVTVTMIIALILAVGWKFLPQQLNLAILPILGIIIVRCWKKVSLLKTGSK